MQRDENSYLKVVFVRRIERSKLGPSLSHKWEGWILYMVVDVMQYRQGTDHVSLLYDSVKEHTPLNSNKACAKVR